VIDFVLSPFDEGGETSALGARIEEAVDAVDYFLLHGIDRAMESVNASPPPASSGDDPVDQA
jgi:peptidyl-tRNA hydrolase